MKKGFTLIELLAVIVILAIIALIAVPRVLDVVEKAEKKAFLASGYGILKAAEFNYAISSIKGQNDLVTFQYTNGVETSNISGSKLIYKGKKPKDGVIMVNKNAETYLRLFDGKYCLEKSYNQNQLTITEMAEEDCLVNIESPVITINGFKSLKLGVNQVYTEVGAIASDIKDGDISSNIVTTNNVNTSIPGTYQVTYKVTDSEGNMSRTEVRTVEVVDAPVTKNSRYLIFEVDGHHAPLNSGPTINEIEVFDDSGNKLDFTALEAFEADGSAPHYWYGVNGWGRNKLNDGTKYYASNASTIFLYNSGTNSSEWARGVLDLGESKDIMKVDFYAGAPATLKRIPKEISAFITDSYDIDTNLKQRTDTNLEKIGDTISFAETDVNPISKSISVGEIKFQIKKEEGTNLLGRAEVFVAAYLNNQITDLKWAYGDKQQSYLEESGTDLINGDSFYATKNGKYTIYAKALNGLTRREVIEVTNVDSGPVITLNGLKNMNLILGTDYIEQGATAFDEVDNHSKDVTISGTVNKDQVGTYTLTYTATDSNGTVSSEIRTVNVVMKKEVDLTQFNSVIYVSESGNDSTGNGTEENPYNTLNKAASIASNGDAIKLDEGTYQSTTAFKTGDISIIGEGKNTIIESSSVSKTTGGSLNIYTLVWKYSGRFLNHTSNKIVARNSVFKATGNVYNFIGYANNRNHEFYNCVIFKDLKSNSYNYDQIFIGGFTTLKLENTYYLDYADGTSRYGGTYNTNTSIIRESFVETKASSNYASYPVTSTLKIDNNYQIIDLEFKNKGTGTNLDGSKADIGVYGGEYGWIQ